MNLVVTKLKKKKNYQLRILGLTGKTTNPGNHPTADQPKLDQLRPVSHTAVLQSSEDEAA